MDLQIIDISTYLSTSCEDEEITRLCKEVSSNLIEKGAILIKDPRCTVEDNRRFINMIERYFSSPLEFKQKHQRPEKNYLVGVTPEGVEVPRCTVDRIMQEKMKDLTEENQPSAPVGADVKWRYNWTLNNRSQEPVIPEGFPEWEENMDSWGHKMLSALEVVAEMAAIGFGLPKDTFTSLMKEGPHLLAPTASDLQKYIQEGTILAGYHYDLDFLTIHGRSTFPGLNIWLKNGKKIEANVPMDCLLVQTGKQMEWLTGGECMASMHDVVVSNKTILAFNEAKEKEGCLWRVSTTFFSHIASNVTLKPFGLFEKSPLAGNYPPISAKKYVEQEIAAIYSKKQEIAAIMDDKNGLRCGGSDEGAQP